MSVTCSKQLYLQLSKYGKRNLFPALGNNFQNFLSVVHYSDDTIASKEKLSKAMKAHLEKALKYDKFMKEQLQEYNLGKKFLATMMGQKGKEMSQTDVDEAIKYLFPSALYVPKSRPVMKPPEELFVKHEDALFDYSGRPFHFLFYTTKPKFSQCLHDAASILESLNQRQWRGETRPTPLALIGGRFYSKDELEKLFHEKIYDIEHEKFVEVLNKISQHAFAKSAEDFVRKYWIPVNEEALNLKKIEQIVNEDGVKVIQIKGVRKKLCFADVTVRHPGKGKIRINNLGLEYFHTQQRREQVIFPLIFTGMLGQVDVEADVEGSGDASQAAAIRLGIAMALKTLVPKEMFLKMKVSGLLQQDFRRRERKKPGKRGARRSYTWLKR